MKIFGSDISKSYQGHKLFSTISFEIDMGQSMGISGPNGSGKTTLLKIISGKVSPSSGIVEYKLDNNSIPINLWYKDIVLATPYLDLPSTMNIEELWNFHFSLKEKKKMIEIKSIADEFQLPLNKKLQDFSSGMLQRTKLLLAFATDVKILMLDEPTELLDEEGIKLYEKYISQDVNSRITIISSNKSRDFVNCNFILDISKFK